MKTQIKIKNQKMFKIINSLIKNAISINQQIKEQPEEFFNKLEYLFQIRKENEAAIDVLSNDLKFLVSQITKHYSNFNYQTIDISVKLYIPTRKIIVSLKYEE